LGTDKQNQWCQQIIFLEICSKIKKKSTSTFHDNENMHEWFDSHSRHLSGIAFSLAYCWCSDIFIPTTLVSNALNCFDRLTVKPYIIQSLCIFFWCCCCFQMKRVLLTLLIPIVQSNVKTMRINQFHSAIVYWFMGLIFLSKFHFKMSLTIYYINISS
jgi:hypothetical protein